VLCSVQTKQGGLIGNLTKDDFQISEDGKPQTIKYFTRETDLPLTIGLLVDVSRSQERLIDIERMAAQAFFAQVLGKKDLAFLISFGQDAELLQDYTNSPGLLSKGLSGLKVNAPPIQVTESPVPTAYNPRGTVLYDTVYLAAHDQLRGQVGRKVLVLITDGVDQGSRYKLEDALRAAQLADTIIYSIEYYDPGAYGFGMGGGGGGGVLKRLAEDTGGHVFRISHKHPLSEAFEEIQREMRSQYAIGYLPTNGARDGSFRRIEIKTRDKDQKVQARKGYYASPPEKS
jgi:VWFA-related protein